MKSVKELLLSIIFTICINSMVQGEINIEINQIDGSNFPEFNLYVSVLDETGKPILGLKPTNFKISEDDAAAKIKEVMPVLELKESEFSRLHVALVLDNSISMENSLDLVSNAANIFIDNMGKNDKASIVVFNKKAKPLRAKILQYFTNVKFILKKRTYLRRLTQRTFLYDAISLAAKSLDAEETLGRKAIVVLSDGADVGSVINFNTMIDELKKFDLPVYTIDFSSRSNSLTLKKIAEKTGGKYYRSHTPSDLVQLYGEIMELLKGQYRISYLSPIQEWLNPYRKITISLEYNHLIAISTKIFEADPAKMERLKIVYKEKTLTISENDYLEYLSRFPNSEWSEDVRFKLGVFYEEHGEYEKAIKIYDQLSTLPQSRWKDDVLFRMGKIYEEQGKYEKAMEKYSQMIQEFPEEKKTPEAMLRLARTFNEIGKSTEAISYYEMLTTTYPGSEMCDEALLELSELYLKNGNAAQAEYFLQEIVSKYRDSNSVDRAFYKLALIYANQGNYDKALVLCDSSMKVSNDNYMISRVLCKKGELYFDKRDWEQAIDIYDHIVQNYSTYGYKDEAIYGLSRTYRETRQYDKMRASYEQLKQMDERGEQVSFDRHEIDQAKEMINPEEGGLVITLSGAEVEIPPATLATPLEISIQSIPTPENIQNFAIAGDVYDFQAPIDSFLAPVKIALPYDPVWFEDSTKKKEGYKIYSYEHGDWKQIVNSEIDSLNKVIFAEVTHFSLKTIMYREPIVIRFKDILFEFNKADLTPQALTQLDTVLNIYKIKPNTRLEIAGHTDSLGSDEYNQTLSLRRAEAIKNYLVKQGVNADLLICKGYGEKFPIASNATEEGRQLNRRTEFIIINKDEVGTIEEPLLSFEENVPLTIQLGAYKNLSQAYEKREMYHDYGLYPVEIVEKEEGGKPLFCLWWGTFSSLDEAKEQATRLAEEFKNLNYKIVGRK